MSAQVREAQVTVLTKRHAVRTHLSAVGLERHGVEQFSVRTQDVDATGEHVGGETTAILVKCQTDRHANVIVVELALLSPRGDLYHGCVARGGVTTVEVALSVKDRPFQA